MVFLCVSALNVKTVDAHAGEMVGPVSGNEYDLLLSKLGGTHRNRVFHFFGVEAPQRTAEALLVAQRADLVVVVPRSFWRREKCGGAVLAQAERSMRSC